MYASTDVKSFYNILYRVSLKTKFKKCVVPNVEVCMTLLPKQIDSLTVLALIQTLPFIPTAISNGILLPFKTVQSLTTQEI